MEIPSLPIRLPEHVLLQQLADGESVFLNLQTEQYFGIDAVGTAMWAVVSSATSIDAARDALLAEFDIDSQTLTRDLSAFLRNLTDRGLVVGSDGNSGSATAT